MITAPHILAAFVVVVGYGLFALVKPHKQCGRCKGTGRSQRYLGVAGPQGKCAKCSGRRKHPRFGAGAVHWLVWSVVAEFRDHRDDRHEQQFAGKGATAGSSFSAPPRQAREAAQFAAARLRAQQRADRLIAFQNRLSRAPAWQFA